MIALQDPPSSTAGRTSWRIDPAASRVEFSIGKRVMLVKKLTVNGRFSNVGGSLEFDPSDPANSRALVKVEAASLDTSDPLAPVLVLDATQSQMRDAHLRQADFFDVANHPYLIFESTTVEPTHGAVDVDRLMVPSGVPQTAARLYGYPPLSTEPVWTAS